MRFGLGFGGGSKPERPLDPPAASDPSRQCTYPVDAGSLRWDLKRGGLTTQYKAFYFSFGDGSAGYVQFAYGNLGVLVKVCPMGFTYYRPGCPSIVLSHTAHASSLTLTDDGRSYTAGAHAITYTHDPSTDTHTWHVRVDDPSLKYDLDFTCKGDASRALVMHDFGRDAGETWLTHRLIPSVGVRGRVRAHGGDAVEVVGMGAYVEALFTHVKFTDMCIDFVNVQVRGDAEDEFLMCMGYVPRAGTRRDGPRIAHGFYARDGIVRAVAFDRMFIDPNPPTPAHDTTDPAALFDTVNTQGRPPSAPHTHADSGYLLPSSARYVWDGRMIGGEGRFRAVLNVSLEKEPTSTTDVLGIFPKFVKDIVAVWAGSPYVFCWRVNGATAYIQEGDSDSPVRKIQGTANVELTNVHRTKE
ncbi:Putative cell survival pathways protein [Savitreella phatthalungensis]